MPDVTVKYWRDIPSMVSMGRGRTAARAQLPERFEQAIDRCAMKVGARDDDAYLAEWRNETMSIDAEGGETPQNVVDRAAASLNAAYGPEEIKALISQEGWRAPKS